MNITKFNIIGHGFVGQSTDLFLRECGVNKENIRYVTRTQNLDFYTNQSLHEKDWEGEITFICLPTPTLQDGTQDLGAINAVMEKIKGGLVVMRSTVLPGTCKRLAKEYKLHVVMMPEFLTEATMYEDAIDPDIVVIGTENKEDEFTMYEIFRGFRDKFIFLNTMEAETSKYAVNCLYSLKVIYVNQLYDFCQSQNINYDKVKKVLYNRKWIGKNHLEAVFRGVRGLTGKCLPKDLYAFATFSESKLLKAAYILNIPLVTNGDGKPV